MEIKSKAQQMAVMGMFIAIILLLAFTPLGFIQLPFIKATIIHIPVIIGAILLGPRYGSALGFLFGLTSLINNTMAPAVSSFVFTPLMPVPGTDSGTLLSLIVCFVPRILVGVVPWFVYAGLKKLCNKRFIEPIWLAIAGIAGSLTNTLLVMHLIYFIFKDSYAAVRNIAVDTVYNFILGIIVANGIPEAIAAAVLTAAICGALLMTGKKKKEA